MHEIGHFIINLDQIIALQLIKQAKVEQIIAALCH